MNDPEKTQPQLAQEANTPPLQEKLLASQEQFVVIEEERLEWITGAGFLDCCIRPKTSSPPKTRPAGSTEIELVGTRDRKDMLHYLDRISSNRPDPEGLAEVKEKLLQNTRGIFGDTSSGSSRTG